MIQVQLKLQLRPAQERMLTRWLWHLTGVYNWTLRKIECDAADRIYHSVFDLKAMVNGHGRRVGMPQVTIAGAVATAHDAWKRCFRRLGRQPKLKGRRNRLNSIAFTHGHEFNFYGKRIGIPGMGRVRFHVQEVPPGRIGTARIVRRASGWYLCLFIHAEPRPVPHAADGEIGIDPGFLSLVTLSTGEKVEHPHELQQTARRLAQAQRGQRRRQVARLLERQANQRKDRNHKLSRRLVSENALIAWSKDSHQAIARRFGKSVTAAAHGQLRTMLAYKCRTGGRRFVEMSNRYSTMTCSACGAHSGPAGYAGLSVRQWQCACGATHDRDCNAAVNTLLAARGMRVERSRETASGIANPCTTATFMETPPQGCNTATFIHGPTEP